MKRKVGNVFYHVFIITFALLMLYPLLWMISASFKDTLEIFQGTHFCLRPLKRIITHKAGKGCQALPSEDFFMNSFLIVIVAMIGNLSSCLLAANAFAKNQVSAEGILVCTYDGNADASHACKADSTVYYVQ